jgi:hypothetical protein
VTLLINEVDVQKVFTMALAIDAVDAISETASLGRSV